MVPGEQVLQPFPVPDGANEDSEIQIWVGPAQLLLDVVGIVFIDVEENQLSRAESGQLAAKLTANAAAASGDQNRLVVDIAAGRNG